VKRYSRISNVARPVISGVRGSGLPSNRVEDSEIHTQCKTRRSAVAPISSRFSKLAITRPLRPRTIDDRTANSSIAGPWDRYVKAGTRRNAGLYGRDVHSNRSL